MNRPFRSIWQLLLVATTLMFTAVAYADEDGWDDDDTTKIDTSNGIHPTKAAHRLPASVVINELGY